MSILSSVLRTLLAPLRARAARAARALRAARLAMMGAGPANIAAIENLARICLDCGDPQTARNLYVRRARLLREPVEPRLYRSAYMLPQLARKGEAYTHAFMDVDLDTTDSAIFQDDRVYVLETSGRNLGKHPLVRHRFTPDGEWFVFSLPEPARTLSGPAILLGMDGGINYSHWVARYVLKLALAERAGIPDTVPLIVNENLRGYQRELLELLGIGEDRLLALPRGIVVHCRELVVPVMLMNHPMMRVGIDWLRSRLAPIIEPVSRSDGLLFVSRRDSPNHVLLNEAEIEAALAQRGFRTVVPGELSFADQVRSFAGARIIVGAHGAGLTNLMFAPPGAAVVEMTSTNLRHMNDFRFITSQMGQRHFELMSDRYAQDQTASYQPNYNFYADAEAVIRTVDAVLGEEKSPRQV